MKYISIKCFQSQVLLIVLIVFPMAVRAQLTEYDAAPKIRSYLQRPIGETEKYIEDVRVPKVFQERDARGLMEELPSQRLLEIPGYSEILIDKKIDPEVYIMGPGDLIGVYLWGELDRDYPLRISPEGLVLIPTVGVIPVSDITLAEATKKIKEVVNGKYIGIDVTVYLIEPRRFRVYISGVVEKPGMYNAHPLLRVSDLLDEGIEIEQELGMVAETRRETETIYDRDKAGLIVRSQELLVEEKKGSSKRAITISREGIKIEADLLLFEKTGNLDANPYVSGGDEIYIPPYMGDIMVYGAVNSEGIYEFKTGDRIKDLVTFGGGLTTIADTSNATMVSYTPDGKDILYASIDLYDALLNNPDNPEYLLKESDRLFVQTKYDYKIPANIILDGQLKFPGEYAITPNITMLSDVVKMAGGFTDMANLEEARIIRATTSALRDLEFERLRLMEVADMSEDEYAYFKLRSRTMEGLIAIDFVKLFRQNDLSHDIFLEPGDHIFIPLQRRLVNVLGAVLEPGFVRIVENSNVDYYIFQAGGFNWDAKKRGVRIIKAKTGQRFRPGKNVLIEGGDIILVPEKEPINYWELFMNSSQVFADVATIIIIARNVFVK
ncbi:SLBB domain-containing protein [Candidatus Latescibacterota bacterium]